MLRGVTFALGTRESNGHGDLSHANAGHVRCGNPENDLLYAFDVENYAGLHWYMPEALVLRSGKDTPSLTGLVMLNAHARTNGCPAGHSEDSKSVVEPDAMKPAKLGENPTVS